MKLGTTTTTVTVLPHDFKPWFSVCIEDPKRCIVVVRGQCVRPDVWNLSDSKETLGCTRPCGIIG